MKKSNFKKCPICSQVMDLIVTSHKNIPYVDNNTYEKMCFTCYCAPKILTQKFNKEGYLISETEIEYNIENLYSPNELYDMGSSDTLSYAKKCIKAIKMLKVKKVKKLNKTKPKCELRLP
jgi:hypothetical protein